MSIRNSPRFVAPSRSTKPSKIDILILAASPSARIKNTSRSLLEVSTTENLLQRQIRIIRDTFPSSDISIVVGYQSDRIIRFINGVRFIENERYEDTNVAHSMSLGLRSIIGNHVLIIYGDLLFNKSAIDLVSNQSYVVYDTKKQIGASEVGLILEGQKVLNFSCGLDLKWAQIAYFTGKELEILRKIVYQKDNDKLFGHEVMNELIARGGQLEGFEPKYKKVLEIDTYKDLERVHGF